MFIVIQEVEETLYCSGEITRWLVSVNEVDANGRETVRQNGCGFETLAQATNFADGLYAGLCLGSSVLQAVTPGTRIPFEGFHTRRLVDPDDYEREDDSDYCSVDSGREDFARGT